MTIQAFNQATAHHFGDALVEQGRLRKRFCIDNRGWKQPVAHGMEYDQFDTPSTWYLIYRDDDGRVWACTRCVPTTVPYMIEELWPEMVTYSPIAKSPRVWEQSRFCIDDNLPRELKGKVLGDLVDGIKEFSQVFGIEELWFMSEPAHVKFTRNRIERLGPNMVVDGKECFVGKSITDNSGKLEFVQWAPDVMTEMVAAE